MRACAQIKRLARNRRRSEEALVQFILGQLFKRAAWLEHGRFALFAEEPYSVRVFDLPENRVLLCSAKRKLYVVSLIQNQSEKPPGTARHRTAIAVSFAG